MNQTHLHRCLLALLVVLIVTHALPAPMSTEVAIINPNHELTERAPEWLGATWRVFAYNAEVVFKVGGCVSVACYQGGNVEAAQGFGIATGILYGIAAVGNSFLPKDYRPGGNRRRGESLEWDKFVDLAEDAGLSDDLPALIEFHARDRDQVTFHTKYADLEVSRLPVIHPVKRSLEHVIRIRTRPDHRVGGVGKRQEGFYGMEAFIHEESDYGYPPDRGWVGETAQLIGDSITEHQTEGDMCMKMINFDGATSYSFIRYDGTPDNEEYTDVFGCDQANYD